MSIYKNLHCQCGKSATWVRETQFSGAHPFCADHAQQERDFGQSDSSYFFWKELTAEDIAPERPEHEVSVVGYEGSMQQLCEQIHRLRFDSVEKFYQYTATELRRQAEGDRAAGRTQLAALLEEVAGHSELQRQKFARIWLLCKPHMENK